MGKSKNPEKSKAQAIREAIEQLQSESREINTSTILALLPGLGVKDAKATDIYYSTPWKEFKAKGKPGKAVPEEAPTIEAVTVIELTPAPSPNGITKGDAVRQVLATLGSEAKPKAIIEQVKEKHGLDVSYQTVLNIKGASAKLAKRRGRPAKVDAVVVTVTPLPAAQKVAPGDISLEDIRLVKELTDRFGAEKVRQLAEVLA